MKNQILLIPDAPQGGTGVPPVKPETDAEKIARLEAESATARATITRYESADAERAETEKIVRAKITLGLTRQQALSVIGRQKAHDAEQKQNLGKQKAEREKEYGPSSRRHAE